MKSCQFTQTGTATTFGRRFSSLFRPCRIPALCLTIGLLGPAPGAQGSGMVLVNLQDTASADWSPFPGLDDGDFDFDTTPATFTNVSDNGGQGLALVYAPLTFQSPAPSISYVVGGDLVLQAGYHAFFHGFISGSPAVDGSSAAMLGAFRNTSNDIEIFWFGAFFENGDLQVGEPGSAIQPIHFEIGVDPLLDLELSYLLDWRYLGGSDWRLTGSFSVDGTEVWNQSAVLSTTALLGTAPLQHAMASIGEDHVGEAGNIQINSGVFGVTPEPGRALLALVGGLAIVGTRRR